ncbi:hypothetical protein CU633_06910 [Bacillus sp. V3-13]|uniref:glycosyltransferase n=1 Tax=Bacillus sp. V3-13 TaxID=2053728 RepID=UPI000C769637|nr:glycosyltransferase family 2 protein [Bacillus sp. V3-13]PLR78240.1 hypothetical protein CU633_06910 [Bacillus sp. V3-13]
MSKITVSLCMIVKDEETHIRRCLESAAKQVDEIIIVDTGSTDSTVRIAKEFGAQIFNFKWEKDFAAARNFSLEHATSDYILVLDADEFLDENAVIQDSIKEQKDFYMINFKNYMDGGYVSNHQAIRLFKNHAELKYRGKIHEHLNIEEFENLTNDFVDFIIHHDGYKKEAYSKKDKFARNLRILEKEVVDHPTGYNLFNLGVQYKAQGDYNKAIDTLKKAYSLSKDQIYLPYLLYLIGDCLLQLGRNREGINLINDSIALFPGYTGYYYLSGFFYEQLNYLKAAERAFEQCLELGEVKYFQSIEGVGSYLASIKLSEIQQKQGQLTKALDSSFSALKMNKHFPPALSQYYTVLKSAGISENEIKENLKVAYPVNETKDLEVIMGVLFAHRSKLIQDYIDDYQLKVNNAVLGIAALYNKRYAEACSLLINEETLASEILSDVTTLFIIHKNKLLAEKLMQQLNLNQQEKRNLISLIENNLDTKVALTDSLFDLIKNVSLNLLSLGEEISFIELYKKTKLNEGEKEELLSLLILRGFSKIVADLLSDEINIINKNHQLTALLADSYTRQNRLNEAHTLYTQLVEQSGDYDSCNRLYCFYEKIGYSEGLSKLEIKMKSIMETDLNASLSR